MRNYGIAAKVCNWQKKGVADGIISIVKDAIRKNGMKISDYKKSYTINEKVIEQTCVTVVIPTSNDIKEAFDYPTFHYYGKYGWIDMIHFDDELHFHIMHWNSDESKFENGRWHTVDEGLTLEDTCKLFEYIYDVKDDIIILPVDESDKYNATGALGVVKS